MIEQTTIDKIVDTAQIVDVVQEFVTLRRRGQNYVGLCPFHSDKSPSFYVNPSKNLCKCFSCGEGGNPVTFLMKKEQMTFYEAIKWLGDKYHIEVEDVKLSDEDRQRQTDREGMFQVNEFAQKCFEDDLFNTPEGRNIGLTYFRERGIQDDTIHRFHLGYALENKQDLATRVLQRGLDRKYLMDGTGVGLCYGDDPKKMPTCRFAGRVIFPHHSLSGKCTAFAGRILQRVDHAFKKYVNSPESPIYHKSDLPYGLYQAKSSIAKENNCYVVEGNVDVLSMSQAGFQNVIAASGTALTTEHIRIIKRFSTNCTLMFDADNAGITASLKSIDLLVLEGMKVKIILLPEGEDPDSFCRHHSAEEVRQYFSDHQQDFITYKANMLMKGVNLNDPIAKAQVVQQLANTVALVADPILCSILIREIAQRTNVHEKDVMNAVNNAKRNNYSALVHQQEIEMRREQANRERQELGIAQQQPADENNGMANNRVANNLATAVDKDDNSDHTENNNNGYTNASSGSATTANAATAATPPPPARFSLPTDKFERNIIKYIVRYGGQSFDISYIDDQGKPQTESIRVIDFYYNELSVDQIVFNHPLYARIYELALAASEDTSLTWDSIRFFSNLNDDPEVQQLAFNLMQDKFDTMGLAENVEQIEMLVPRSVLELKNSIITMQIDQELRHMKNLQPGENFRDILTHVSQLKQVQKALDKQLGERVITSM